MNRRIIALLFLVASLALSCAADAPPQTVAEKSDYKATSRHADVMAFCEQLAKQSPVVRLGVRANSQGLDLNRDYVKLESPEVKALVRFFNKWDPAVFVDCHTTDGSFHRYTITYEAGRCPAGDSRLVDLVQDEMLPAISK